MSTGVIIFTVIYFLVLCTYFITETSGKMKLRAPNKILLAAMFTIFAIVAFCLHPNEISSNYISVTLLVAIILAALGDVFLLFSFNHGLDFFLAGNIAFIAFETTLLTAIVPISTFWWIYLLAPIMVTILGVCFVKFPNFFKVGKKKPVVLFYASSIFMHGITGLAIAIYTSSPAALILGLGSLLFMFSDIAITFNKFVCPDNKWVLRLNSALYFTGLYMIVLSMVI